MAKGHCLFKVGSKVMEHLPSAVPIIWMNCILKRHDAALSQFTKDISLKDKERSVRLSGVHQVRALFHCSYCTESLRRGGSLCGLTLRQMCLSAARHLVQGRPGPLTVPQVLAGKGLLRHRSQKRLLTCSSQHKQGISAPKEGLRLEKILR